MVDACSGQMRKDDPIMPFSLPPPSWLSSGAHDVRSEEHTSELQSQSNIVCRLLLEKKNAGHDDLLRRTGNQVPDDLCLFSGKLEATGTGNQCIDDAP